MSETTTSTNLYEVNALRRVVATLTAERDRQYEFNAGQIVKCAVLEAERDALKIENTEIKQSLVFKTEESEFQFNEIIRVRNAGNERVRVWKQELEMYQDAWLRELGGKAIPKHHFIDALVLTTRKLKEERDALKADFYEADALRAKFEDENSALKAKLERLTIAAQALTDGMETCHECKGTVLVGEQPVHCEDCSYDCESHEGAECATIYSLHLALKKALLSARAQEDADGKF
jgi:hypothetical protein